MKRISKNITYKEATFSPTAVIRGINNNPSKEELKAMINVAEVSFQPVREWLNKPIRINSFYRSKELNSAIGGSLKSQHVKGEAIDIDTIGDNRNIFDWLLKNGEFDQLIWEFGNESDPDWIHISCKLNIAENRKQVLKAVRIDGRVKYQRYNPI